MLVSGGENSRTIRTGRISLQIAPTGRTTSIAGYGAIELHVRRRNSLSHLQ